jgi:hypothetical protein
MLMQSKARDEGQGAASSTVTKNARANPRSSWPRMRQCAPRSSTIVMLDEVVKINICG